MLKNDLICIKKKYDDIFIIVNDNIPYDISSEIIYELENKLIIKLSQLRQQSIIIGLNSGQAQYLPKIQIPKFNGDFLKWLLFKNLFKDCIYIKI